LSYHFYNFDQNSFKETADGILGLEFEGLLFAPVFYEESLLFLEKFKEKNIPIVMIDSDIVNDEEHHFIGQNSFQSGYLCGRLISFAVKDIRRVLVIKNEPEIERTSVFLQRIKGFYSFFEENKNLSNFTFSEIIINDSLNSTLNLDMFEDIDSIFVPNSRAYIVAQFLEKNNIVGKRVVGYDLLKKNIEYLNKGFIDFLINQKPENQGYMGVQLLYKKLVLHEPVESTYYMPLEIIVKENYAESNLYIKNT
jgi:LacI family transcriptional regulator